MAINRSVGRTPVSVAEAQLARVASEGTSRHPHLVALLEASGPHAGRELADYIRLLRSLHGRYPDLIQIELAHCRKGAADEWLGRWNAASERDRLYRVIHTCP